MMAMTPLKAPPLKTAPLTAVIDFRPITSNEDLIEAARILTNSLSRVSFTRSLLYKLSIEQGGAVDGCYEGKKLVGVMVSQLKPPEGLQTLAIALLPAYRGRGIGTWFAEYGREQARRKNVKVITSLFVVGDAEALGFHLKVGFHIVGVDRATGIVKAECYI